MAVKVADAFIAIGGDLTGYRKSLGQARTETQSLGQQIRTALTNPAGFGGASKIGGLIADLKLGRSLTNALRDATHGLGGSLKGLSVSALHAGLNGIKGILGGLKGLAADVFKGFSIGVGIGSVQAFGRLLSDLVNVIPDLVGKGREYLRMVDDIADATGAGSVETSKFTATLLYLGVPLGGVINMIGQASRNLELMGPRLEALGIKVKNANGAWLNQIQILFNARQAMSEWGAGSKKVDILAREFGRGGLKTLVDFLNLTDEQFKRITDDAQRMGLVVTEQQRNLGEAAVRENARFQNVLTGLGTALFTSVGPAIMNFFSNLTDTIVANMDAIKQAVSSAISFVIGAVSSLVGMTAGLDSFSQSIEDANAVTSPYSSDIIDLTDQITKLGDTTDSAKEATDGQRKSIQKSIDVIGDQIAALKALDTQQDRTYDDALEALNAQLSVQEKLLDAEEQEIDRTRALRDAKIALFEAQAQFRADTLAGKSTDQDVLNVARAQEALLDIQRNQAADARKDQLQAVRDFIAEIDKLVSDSTSGVETLADLAAREKALRAGGPAEVGSDRAIQLAAVLAAEQRVREQAANTAQQTALEAQKAALTEELSNVRSAAVDATEIKKKELEKQLAALVAQELAWAKLTGKERDDIAVVTQAINAKPGLTQAINEARLAGIKFGEDVKAAFGDVLSVVSTLGGALGTLASAIDGLPDIPAGAKVAIGLAIAGLGATHGNIPLILAGLALAGLNVGGMEHVEPPKGSTSWTDWAARAQAGQPTGQPVGVPPGVLPSSIVNAIRPAAVLQMPAFAGAGASGQPVVIRVEVGGNKLIDYIDERLYARRR